MYVFVTYSRCDDEENFFLIKIFKRKREREKEAKYNKRNIKASK